MSRSEQEQFLSQATDIRTPRTLTVGPPDAQLWMSPLMSELFLFEELTIAALKKAELDGSLGQARAPLTMTSSAIILPS